MPGRKQARDVTPDTWWVGQVMWAWWATIGELTGQVGQVSGSDGVGLVGQAIWEHHRPAWVVITDQARGVSSAWGLRVAFWVLSGFIHVLSLHGGQLRVPG